MKVSVLDNGKWKDIGDVKELFSNSFIWTGGGPVPPHHNCISPNPVNNAYLIFSTGSGIDREFISGQHLSKKLESSTLNGFLKINLLDQDFLHKIYAFVLARQMMALGRLPNDLLTGAVYKINGTNNVFVFSDALAIISSLPTDVLAVKNSADGRAARPIQISWLLTWVLLTPFMDRQWTRRTRRKQPTTKWMRSLR